MSMFLDGATGVNNAAIRCRINPGLLQMVVNAVRFRLS
jgi:hypothetical protein